MNERSYSDRIDVLRGWLGERDFARLEAAVARSQPRQELEAWILQAILDCVEASEDAAGKLSPVVSPVTSRVIDTTDNVIPVQLSAVQWRTLEAFAERYDPPGMGPRAVGRLIELGLVEEEPPEPPHGATCRSITPSGRAQLARRRADKAARERAIDDEDT